MRLKSVNILGCEYTITYVDKPSDVDILQHESFWGQIDYWTHSIRIYQKGLSERDIFEILVHEVLHGICNRLKLKELNKDENHDELDLMAMAVTDFLYANKLLNMKKE